MFLLRSVCLSVGWLTKLWTDFDEISWRGRAWPRDQWVQFWWRSRSPSDPGVRNPHSLDYRKSYQRIWWNFMESWGCGQRPTDCILLTIRITIRIREELPRCQHTQNRCPAKIIQQSIMLAFGGGLCILSTSFRCAWISYFVNCK